MENLSPLRMRRIAKGLTQAALSSAAGVSQQLMSKLETGKIELSPERALEFSRILECSPLDLLPTIAGATPKDRDELDLVQIHRDLSPDGQTMLMRLARTLLSDEATKAMTSAKSNGA